MGAPGTQVAANGEAPGRWHLTGQREHGTSSRTPGVTSCRLLGSEEPAKLKRVSAPDNIQSVVAIVMAAQERTARQIASLELIVAAIVEGAELTATDDEHDPEGATIAYERAQATALLRQAREDCEALVITRRQLEARQRPVCTVCRSEIDLERVAALPTATRCIGCAA